MRPGATYPHKNAQGLCSFAALVHKRLASDPVLVEMARIVQAADFQDQLDSHPVARGLALVSYGFPLITNNDNETTRLASFLYDSLYASINESHGRPLEIEKKMTYSPACRGHYAHSSRSCSQPHS